MELKQIDYTYNHHLELPCVLLLTPKSELTTLKASMTIRQALESMRHSKYTAMAVLDQHGHYVGTVNEGDFLWYLLDTGQNKTRELEDDALKAIVRKDWNPSITAIESVASVLDRIMDQNFVPVVDDRGMFMGIITRKSVIAYTIRNMKKNRV